MSSYVKRNGKTRVKSHKEIARDAGKKGNKGLSPNKKYGKKK
jgi:hypothetical protein